MFSRRKTPPNRADSAYSVQVAVSYGPGKPVRLRIWPVLLFGFSSLLFLIWFAGFGALKRATESYSGTAALYAEELQTEQLLGGLRSDILLSAIEARDILLLPSQGLNERLTKISRLQASSEVSLRALKTVLPAEYGGRFQTLSQQVDAYWRLLAAITVAPREPKTAFTEQFLNGQMLPKRQTVLTLAAEIELLTRDSIRKHRSEIDRRQAGLPLFVYQAVGGTLLLGLLVAVISLIAIIRLEKTAAERHLAVVEKEEELRRLSQKLVKAQEEERRSLSRDLHDQIGQVLTAVRISVGNVEEALLNPDGTDKIATQLDQAKRLSEQALRSVRDIAMGLRPAMLDDLGLEAALEWQAKQFSRLCAVPVSATVKGDLDSLSEPQRICVYRVVQEALNNVAKHAKASEITLFVAGEDAAVRIEVRDNGAGFDATSVKDSGMGLVGIKERVRQLGGKANVESRPGEGTALQAWFPVHPSPEPA